MNARRCLSWALSLPVLAFAVCLPGCGTRFTEYTSREGGFHILLPGEPSTEKDPDVPSRVHKITYVEQAGSYTVAWEDLGDDKLTPEERLDQACTKGVRQLKGKTLSQTEITLAGTHPGRDLVAEWPEGRGLVHDRIYLVDRRLYHVMASGSKWWVESPASQKVLGSFRLAGEER